MIGALLARRCRCTCTPTCATGTICASIATPKGFLLTVPEVEGVGVCCGRLGGDHYVVHQPLVDMLTLPTIEVPDQVWTGASTNVTALEDFPENGTESPDQITIESCAWLSIRPGVKTRDDVGEKPTEWAVKQLLSSDPCDDTDSTYRVDFSGPFSGTHPAWWVGYQRATIDSVVKWRLVAVGSAWHFYTGGLFPYWAPLLYATYVGPWAVPFTFPAVGATTTLDLLDRPNPSYSPTASALVTPVQSPYGCTFPETITAKRLGEAAERVLSGCDKLCDPEIFGGETGVVILQGLLAGIAFRVCLAGGVDLDPESATFGLFSFVGSLGDHDGCPGVTLTFTLLCVPGPGGGVWTLRVTDGTTTVDLPVEVTTGDPLSATVSGTLTGLCSDATLVADLSDCGGVAPLPSCFGTTTDAEACCADGRTLSMTGSTVIGPAEGCDGPSCENLVSSLGLSYGTFDCGGTPLFGPEWFWSGPVPNVIRDGVGGTDLVAGMIVVFRCIGGVWTPFLYDPANTGSDCDSGISLSWIGGAPGAGDPTGEIQINTEMQSCCNGEGGIHKFTVG